MPARRFVFLLLAVLLVYGFLFRSTPYNTAPANSYSWGKRQYLYSGKGLDQLSIVPATQTRTQPAISP